MAGTQRFPAVVMAFLIVSTGTSASGKLDVVGVVAQANHAMLGSQSVSEGTTIYDGDGLSTDAEGTLRVLIGQAVLHLAEQSSVVMHDNHGSGGPAGERQFAVELLAGTVVLSMMGGNTGELEACAARVRPVSAIRGVVRVQILGAHELLVYAQQGDAEVSYRNETETVAQGKTVRVLLNAQDGGQSGGDPKQAGHRKNKMIVLVTIAAGAALATGLAFALRGSHSQASVESPDRP